MNNNEVTGNGIIYRICKSGGKAYLVGGAIRDEFLGLEPDDFDIVTDLTPEELQNIFFDKKIKLVGANFLVTLIDDIEVATFRSDRNFGFGRFNCETVVCKTLNEDLSRRDFTFNALAVCPYTGEIIDLFNGMSDLKNKIVRFIGDGNQRIYEDPLRMLRAARFACLINGSLCEETQNAININKNMITHVSPERIRIELLKVMKYKTPSIFFNILFETGLLEILLPELYKCYGHPGGQHHKELVNTHSLLTGNCLSPNDPILRLIGYLHDIGKVPAYKLSNGKSFVEHEDIGSTMIGNLFSRYKFTNEEIIKAKGLVLLHMRSTKDLTPRGSRRLLKAFSENHVNWRDWLKLKIADKNANLGKEHYTRAEIKEICLKLFYATHESQSGEFKITDLAIDGNDVMEILNIKPCRKVGDILKYLLDNVIDNPELNTKEQLTEIVKNEF